MFQKHQKKFGTPRCGGTTGSGSLSFDPFCLLKMEKMAIFEVIFRASWRSNRGSLGLFKSELTQIFKGTALFSSQSSIGSLQRKYQLRIKFEHLKLYCLKIEPFAQPDKILLGVSRVHAALLKIKSTTYKLFFAIFLTTLLLQYYLN